MIILSKLADYGVIVASHMALAPDRQVTAAALAAETRLPRATVAKVLKTLAHAGIVTGARGASGGYRLARSAHAIALSEIIQAIDGLMAPTQCTSHLPECSRAEFCSTRPHWQRINRAVGAALGAITLAELTPFGAPATATAIDTQPRVQP
ncbi:MAG TPA: SUF system Fe-S cluster assembly regulator [Stellaceae bacterium]|jgi:FeS assembly SUF system regulator|nr:SUF system Fe-S cluster assembly regulator [Stellaceae bacterium]